VAYTRGAFALAAERLDEALAMQRELDYGWWMGLTLAIQGNLCRDRGDVTRARSYYAEALALGVAHEDKRILAIALEGSAEQAVAAGDAARAGRLFGAAAVLRESAGIPVDTHLRGIWERGVTVARAVMGEAEYAAAWEAGRALSLEQAIAEATAAPDEFDRARATPASSLRGGPALSPRELEVVRLVVAGKTDQQIADALFIGKRTVTTHLSNILTKLDLANRTEVAAWAVRQGLA
jgi:DNA-binding CsgD family transcriptional regulator